MRMHIRQGRLLDPSTKLDRTGDLFIDEGRIIAIDTPPAGFEAEETIDAQGLWVFPGLVDLAARLREPGQEHKGTISSETLAAASGGITTLCCPPDTDPPIDTPAEINLIQRLARQSGNARVVPLGSITRDLAGEQLSELGALKAAGLNGVSNGLIPITNTLVLRRALEYATGLDLTVHIHPIDPWLANGGCAHEGAVATRLGLPAIPAAAETAALGQLLALVEETGAHVHFCRLSTARGVALVARAQAEGLPVSADVAAHQLFLTEMDLADFNSLCHVIPPLRTQRDLEALRQGVADGVLGAICSDHQPHEADAKLAPFPATAPGMSALETLLPLTLRLAEEGALDLHTALQRVTAGPAGILGIQAGRLDVGMSADLVIYDPQADWTLDREQMHSRGHNTPFQGWSFTGRVRHTLFGGRSVYTTPE
ncbi:MAG: dihydroorotase [Gammaproteobacteria bacterium]|jgi:dihydroorotase